jgi:hypothetical protein
MRRPLLATTLISGLLLAGAGPAAAATRQFDMWTSRDLTQGRAHAYGVVDFVNSYQVTVRGRLNDVCEADGHGAYLRVTFFLDNGNTRQLSAKDTTTCSNADGVDIWLTQDLPYVHKITAVKLYLYEYDAQRNSTADTTEKRIKSPF